MFDNLRKILFGNSMKSSNFGFRSRANSRSNNCKRCVYNLVSFEQAKYMIETESVVLIDVRTNNEYNFMHIKNAINIPVDEITNRIDEIDKTKDIMVYCASRCKK